MSRGKIVMTLNQMRIAAKKQRRGLPACHDETMKLITSLHDANYHVPSVWKHLKEAEDCLQKAGKEKKKKKASTLYYLNKFLKRDKF
mmetsp:Transcript_27629/g.33585  ORF Transcript_27629/g.33585 Transcript_27629/m.33585 type:complete len:87 (+) Transcript_27629:204-464(+)|eukprot:CAMPEP_0172494884 /NCGR_PEP_ID=MMETSP1066-20121228/57586_1 /TAXON_ID=671091 /ORGANISM="Coscinodiscus wailesii, Strain CCMP2513" /LENGTH=86 /DNA_ID=CAMNT_0013266189 /DNA_START=204 /DNA_END=464 /DNA_ORIENTATION=-